MYILWLLNIVLIYKLVFFVNGNFSACFVLFYIILSHLKVLQSQSLLKSPCVPLAPGWEPLFTVSKVLTIVAHILKLFITSISIVSFSFLLYYSSMWKESDWSQWTDPVPWIPRALSSWQRMWLDCNCNARPHHITHFQSVRMFLILKSHIFM